MDTCQVIIVKMTILPKALDIFNAFSVKNVYDVSFLRYKANAAKIYMK